MRLLDVYVDSGEQPIPEVEVYSVVNARDDADRAATDAVLAEFWRKADGGWICTRQ